MNTAGVRGLKNRLSEYLRRVRRDEEVLVTNRGKMVTELRHPGREPTDVTCPGLVRHARVGKARLGAPNHPDLYPLVALVVPLGTVRRLLDQERGDR